MIARIIVTPKKSVLDPQGEAVRRAIHSLGFDAVSSARIGKYIELEITGTNADAIRKKLEEISGDLLSNPVVEDYVLQLETTSPTPTKSAISAAIKAIKAEPEERFVETKAAKAPATKTVTIKASKVAKTAPAPKPSVVKVPPAKTITPAKKAAKVFKAAIPAKAAAPAPAKKAAKKK